MITLRCGNMEQENKYWLRENYQVCFVEKTVQSIMGGNVRVKRMVCRVRYGRRGNYK